MHLNELKALHVSEVLKQAEELEIENTGRMRKQELMFAIISCYMCSSRVISRFIDAAFCQQEADLNG